MERNVKMVLLAGKGSSTNIVYNYVDPKYPFLKVILEGPESRLKIVERRKKRLGMRVVAGQLLFQGGLLPVLKMKSHERIKQILAENGLSISDDYKKSSKCVEVESVNSEECKSILQELQPEIVIVNGTRIISKDILECVDSVFINMHVGITPKYRGVHGAYWALYHHDPEHCGVTVHLVNPGIDTGRILYQSLIHPSKEDNFCTYPYLQDAEGVKLEIRAIEDVIRGQLHPEKVDLPSKLYYHPTLWQYISKYILEGIK